MFYFSGPQFKDTENFYIDVFNGGQFLTKRNCPRIGGVSRCPIEKYNIHEAATAIEVYTFSLTRKFFLSVVL